jgi:prolyl 4-hydroxylase
MRNLCCCAALAVVLLAAAAMAGDECGADGGDCGGKPARAKVVGGTFDEAAGAVIADHNGVALVDGVHYSADYDVDRVELTDPRAAAAKRSGRAADKFKYIDPARLPYKARYVSDRPRILLVPDFLSHRECNVLIQKGNRSMTQSPVTEFDDPNKTNQYRARTSTQTWLYITDHFISKVIVPRLRTLTGFPADSNEVAVQLLHYTEGQKYDAHQDFFDPKHYGKQPTNRAVTAFMYLNDVAEGGETWFPRASAKPNTWDSDPYAKQDVTSCTGGIRVKPTKGTLMLFYDMLPDGAFDHWAMHGACRAATEEKWAATIWFRIPTPWDA